MTPGPVIATDRIGGRRGWRVALAWVVVLAGVVGIGVLGRSAPAPASRPVTAGASIAAPGVAAKPTGTDRPIVGTGTAEFTWPITILAPDATSTGIATASLSIDGETVASAGRVEVRLFSVSRGLLGARTVKIEPRSRGPQGGIVEFSATIELPTPRPLGRGSIRVTAFDPLGRLIGSITRTVEIVALGR